MKSIRSIQATAVAAGLLAVSAGAQAGITSKVWGTLPDGTPVHLYTLTNGNGMKVVISDLGGIINQLDVPGKDGIDNVVLGLQTPEQYLKESPYFGAIIGRYANRIGHGKFTLDGETYKLALNNTPNDIGCCLHGGTVGFDKHVFKASPGGSKTKPALILTYTSPDGQENFPGTLRLKVIYRLLPNNALRIEYSATTDKDTVINFTNHAYFNLGGEGNGTILGEEVQIPASHYTPTDKGLIPTGKIASVTGTPFDWRQPHKVGDRIHTKNQQLKWAGGYDQNYVLDKPLGEFGLAAKVFDSRTNRLVLCYTDQPGFQLYVGNFLDGTITGISGKKYLYRGALTLETQHYPDSPNHPNFPTTELKAGKVFRSVTEYVFKVAKKI